MIVLVDPIAMREEKLLQTSASMRNVDFPYLDYNIAWIRIDNKNPIQVYNMICFQDAKHEYVYPKAHLDYRCNNGGTTVIPAVNRILETNGSYRWARNF